MSQTRKFCTTVINKPWWGSNLPVLLNNEGGFSGMKVHAIMSIISVEDIKLGLKAYGKYLREEYGSNNHELLPLDEAWVERLYPISGLSGREVPAFLEAVPPSQERLYSQYVSLDAQKDITPGQDVLPHENKYSGDVLRYLTLSGQELEFFRYYTSVKDIKEASALVGIGHDEGFRIYDRVKHRAARHNLNDV
jgi:hypothetical protein